MSRPVGLVVMLLILMLPNVRTLWAVQRANKVIVFMR